jgi:hypothetical protein
MYFYTRQTSTIVLYYISLAGVADNSTASELFLIPLKEDLASSTLARILF